MDRSAFDNAKSLIVSGFPMPRELITLVFPMEECKKNAFLLWTTTCGKPPRMLQIKFGNQMPSNRIVGIEIGDLLQATTCIKQFHNRMSISPRITQPFPFIYANVIKLLQGFIHRTFRFISWNIQVSSLTGFQRNSGPH